LKHCKFQFQIFFLPLRFWVIETYEHIDNRSVSQQNQLSKYSSHSHIVIVDALNRFDQFCFWSPRASENLRLFGLVTSALKLITILESIQDADFLQALSSIWIQSLRSSSIIARDRLRRSDNSKWAFLISSKPVARWSGTGNYDQDVRHICNHIT
jgi:hypothetical protein